MTRLIVHAPTVAALRRARRNIANLLAADPEALVELVVNSEAAIAAIDDPDPATADYVVVCENSLAAAGRDNPPGVRTIPTAVLHIARRQAEGWSYFRA